jgi:hypothetical protein
MDRQVTMAVRKEREDSYTVPTYALGVSTTTGFLLLAPLTLSARLGTMTDGQARVGM